MTDKQAQIGVSMKMDLPRVKKKTKFNSIQVLRGLAAVLVLVHHVAGMEQRFGASSAWLPHFLHLGYIGVDVFFVVSGFVIALVAADVGDGVQARVLFTLDRLARIYPLYWLVSLLLWLALLFNPNLVRSFDGVQPDLASSLLLWPQSGTPLLMVGWTLVHEVYFYLVVALGLFLGINRLGLLLVWALAVLLGCALSEQIVHSPILQIIFNPLTLEFIFGGLVFVLLRSQIEIPLWGGWLSVAIGILLVGLGLGKIQVDPNHGTLARSLTLGGGIALGFLALMVFEKQRQVLSSKWLVGLGDASYSLYLWHLPVVYSFGWVWYSKAPLTAKPLGPFLAVGLAIIWAVFSQRYLESLLATAWRSFRNNLIEPRH